MFWNTVSSSLFGSSSVSFVVFTHLTIILTLYLRLSLHVPYECKHLAPPAQLVSCSVSFIAKSLCLFPSRFDFLACSSPPYLMLLLVAVRLFTSSVSLCFLFPCYRYSSLIVFLVISVLCISCQHVVVHINWAAVIDSVPQAIRHTFLTRVAWQAQLKETRLGCGKGVHFLKMNMNEGLQ